MGKTNIDWCDYSINPVKGLCPMACGYCYARRIYKRFKWNPEIRYMPEAMEILARIPDGAKVFWGSTMELFGSWIPKYALSQIFEACQIQDNLIHIFLTKRPQALKRYSPFPDNCWVGVSVTADGDMTNAYYGLHPIKAGKRFISCEPLLGAISMKSHRILEAIDWVIIGQQTPVFKKTIPRIEWVKEIVDACDKASIPVFLKNNLKPLIDKFYPDDGLSCNHDRTMRTPHPILCPSCDASGCDNCGAIWNIRQEMLD